MIEDSFVIDVPAGMPPSLTSAEYMTDLAWGQARWMHPEHEPARVAVERTAITGRWLARVFYPDEE